MGQRPRVWLRMRQSQGHQPRGGHLRFGLLGMESNPNPEGRRPARVSKSNPRQEYPHSAVSGLWKALETAGSVLLKAWGSSQSPGVL